MADKKASYNTYNGSSVDTLFFTPKTSTKTEAETGVVDNSYMTPLKTAQAIAKQTSKKFVGTCSTSSGTTAKIVSITGFTSADLVSGTRVSILFSNTNTSTIPTLNINSTGAKSILYRNTSFSTNNRTLWYFQGNLYLDFIYNGTSWILCDMQPLAHTDALITAGTESTPRLVSAAQLKLAAQTWGGSSSGGGGGWELIETLDIPYGSYMSYCGKATGSHYYFALPGEGSYKLIGTGASDGDGTTGPIVNFNIASSYSSPVSLNVKNLRSSTLEFSREGAGSGFSLLQGRVFTGNDDLSVNLSNHTSGSPYLYVARDGNYGSYYDCRLKIYKMSTF